MKKHISIGSVVMLAAVIFAAGCSKATDGAVIAKVNRTNITVSEFKKQIEDLSPQMQQAVASDAKARKEFLEDLVGIELVIQEAKRLGLDKDADFKKRQDALRKDLERRIQDEAKNELFNTVLKKEIGEKLSKIAEPTPQEIREFYDKNKDKIRNSAGKTIALKDIEPQLKMRIMQEKRREIYLDYAKGLKAKASVSIDDKALDAASATLLQPKEVDLSNMKVQPAPQAAPKKDAAAK